MEWPIACEHLTSSDTILAGANNLFHWLTSGGPIGLAALIGAGVAMLGYIKWHREGVGMRKVQLAEDILADFYEATDVLKWARVPAGFVGEGETRPIREDEDAHKTWVKNNFWRSIERLQRKKRVFKRLESKESRAMVYFGKGVKEPFQDLRKLYIRIHDAAQNLLLNYSTGSALSGQWIEWQRTIGWHALDASQPKGDPIDKEIDALVKTVENFYGPWLKR